MPILLMKLDVLIACTDEIGAVAELFVPLMSNFS